MSYKFDDKMKEGLTRGEKLFTKVAREREVLENAEEDLNEYYEKTQKTSPGLEKGKKIFSNDRKSYRCHSCSFSTDDSSQAAEHQEKDKNHLITPNPLPGVRTVGFENDDKSYMPNGCSGPNGCSAKMMKKNSPETTDGAAAIVKGSGPIKSIGSTQDNDNLVGYVEGKGKNLTSSDGEAGSSHLSNREGKNEDGFRGEVGLDNSGDNERCAECDHLRREHSQGSTNCLKQPCSCDMFILDWSTKENSEACKSCGHSSGSTRSVSMGDVCSETGCRCVDSYHKNLKNGLATPTNKKCPTCDGPVVPTEGVSGSNNQYTCKRCAQDFDTTELKNSFTNCAGACGCSESSHKPNAPERCGCSCAECEEKKHEYALKNAGPGKCKECGFGLSEKDEDYGECTSNNCSIAKRQRALRAAEEEKNNSEQSEYPHDILPNSKGGLKIGQSKYGTK